MTSVVASTDKKTSRTRCDSHLPGCGVRNGGRQGEGGGSPDAGTLPSASQIGRLRSRLHPLAFLLVSILIPNQDLVVFTDFLGLGFCLLPLARLRPKMLETDYSGGHGNHLDKWVGDLDWIVLMIRCKQSSNFQLYFSDFYDICCANTKVEREKR